MRFARVIAALAVFAGTFAAFPAFAHHKPIVVALVARPPLKAKQPWGLTLVVTQDGKPIARQPRLHATLGGMKRSFRSEATGRRGYYRVRVVLPKAGRWTLAAQVGRRTEALGRIRVRAG
jgi:hypothetical protein